MGHVIITGGSSGIGLAVAQLYAARGEKISLIARTQSNLDIARDTLLGISGVTAHSIRTEAADVAVAAEISAAIRSCEDAFGPCDILVTSAGIVEPGTFADQAPEVFDRQMDTNFSGSVHAVRSVYSGMKHRRAGRIMLVSSGAGLIGIHGYSAYCASKFALHGFAEALRSEARPFGVTVSVCFPPDTLTPQFAREIALRSPQSAVIMGSVKPWAPEAVAEKIVSALDRGQFEVFFGATLLALGRFGSIAKPFLNGWFDRAIRRMHQP